MTEAIKRWITNRTGLVMNMNPVVFATNVMDGTIIAKILYSYNIISEHQSVKVLPTRNSSVAYQNLKRISHWLKAVGIHCSDRDLLEIANENSLSAIKLFYELYLNLQDKDKLHFVAQRRGNQRLHPNNLGFAVTTTEEEDLRSLEYTTHPLSKPLTVNRDMIEWSQNRYQKLLETYNEMRKLYSKYLKKKFQVPIAVDFKTDGDKEKCTDTLDLRSPEIEDNTYEELVEQEEAAKQMQKFYADPNVTKAIVKKLKQKRREEIIDREAKRHQQKMLLLEFWNELLSKQEKDFDDTISNKLLKQSMFEKQMVTKMFEVRLQKHNLLYNRRFMDEETMKKREEEFLEQVFLRDKGAGDQKYNYYFERDRTLELHRRLYAERLRLNGERNYKMCMDVVQDLVNMSIRHSEYLKKYSEPEVPKWVQTEWANLFTKQQPIFDLLKDASELAQDNTFLPSELEEIYSLEIHRQNELDQRDFEKYNDFEWPWELEDLLTNFEDNLVPVALGMNVLGHNVHRVLLTKYPKPKAMETNIPKVKVAACINGLTDLAILPVLQKLLDFKGVKVLEMQQAINYCLEKYKDEIRTEYIDQTLIEEAAPALAQAKGKGKEKEVVLEKGKKDAKAKPLDFDGSVISFPKIAEAQCQTPLIYPCEEIVLTVVGELGKTAYDLLNLGEQLTDNLVVAMFVQYLQTLKDIEGWVLINYPTTFTQAVVLEEALTGMQIQGTSSKLNMQVSESIGDIADLMHRESQWEHEEFNSVRRKSKLLPNPDPPTDESYFNSFLTAFISLHKKEQTLEAEAESCSEIIEEVPDALDQFYSDQGCNYAFFYDFYELETIKHLAKLIIGEYTIPPKTSLELFGDTLLYVEANLGQFGATPGKEPTSVKTGEKQPPPKKPVAEPSVPSEKDKGDKKGKGVTIVAVTCEDKGVQVPEEEVPIETLYMAPPPPEPVAGEPLWRYEDLKFPDFFQVALASLWENAEQIYRCDFKELFFIKRVVLKAVVPYLTYVKRHMKLYITRPDSKQTHLYQFQKDYNEVDDDLRDDEEVKAEFHCRIAEFREKLWQICDIRMQESETERKRIIKECWLPYQACELINNYVNAMQLEIDRCCDTFQFVTDYYTGVITKMPSGDPPLQKNILRRIIMSDSKTSVTSTAESLRNAFIVILIQPGTSSENTYLHEFVEVNLEAAHGAVEKWKSAGLGLVGKMDAMFKPGKKGGAAKPKPGKKDAKQLPPFFEPAPDVLQIGVRLIQEWTCAIQGEYLRVKLRLNMLAERALRDLNDTLRCCQKAFYGIYDDIKDRYNHEVESVNTACEIFARVVEAEVKLQPELIFDGDRFYVEPKTLVFPEPLPEPEPLLREPEIDGVFTIEQLDVIVDILTYMAPTAIMPERAFVFLLQDLVVQKAEDGKGPMVPLLWQKLLPTQVSKLSREVFGDVEFVDWRDFIISNLCLAFPNREELLLARSQFRENDPDSTEIVLDYHFFDMLFWFEKDFDEKNPQEILRKKLTKNLLFKMFKIREDGFNYTTFLLAFCKDAAPMEGFAKGLTLVLGKTVCWNAKIGEMYLKSVLEQRYLDQQAELQRQLEHDNTVKFSQSIMDSLINTTVHLCESVIIEDYQSENSLVANEDTSATASFGIDRDASRLSNTPDSKMVVKIFSNEFEISDSAVRFEDDVSQAEFSNVEIGFQPYYNSDQVYILSFDTVLTLITAALPWHAKAQNKNDKSLRQRLEVVFDSLRNDTFNNNVLAYELLNNRDFKNLFTNNFKFVAKYPPLIVDRIVRQNGV